MKRILIVPLTSYNFSWTKLRILMLTLKTDLITPPSNSLNHKLEDFNEISTEEVKKIIMESKPTTCGSDPIPSTVVKHHLNILLPIITRIIKWSLRTGSFHKIWKKSIITPLKKGRARHRVHQLQACE